MTNGEGRGAGTEVRPYTQGFIAPHPSIRKDAIDVDSFLQARQLYTPEYLHSITPAHRNPTAWHEFLGWYWHVAVRGLVWLALALLGAAGASEAALSRRTAFFSTAGTAVGAAGALANHLKSWLGARPDNGWVHTLAAEAECARTHSGIIMAVARPSLPERLVLLVIQAQVFLQYLMVYLLAPGMAHAYSAYRAEEQVFNYSQAARLVERGSLRRWKGQPAPDLARAYYGMPAGATLYDALLRMRADEACLNHINWVFAGITPCDRHPLITMSIRARE